MKYLLSCFLILIKFSLFSQLTVAENSKIDSLNAIINSSKNDTVKINAWRSWDDIILNSDSDLSIELNNKIVDLSSSILEKKGSDRIKKFHLLAKANANKRIAKAYQNQSNLIKTIEYTEKSIETFNQIGDLNEVAQRLTFIAIQYRSLGIFKKSHEFFLKSQSKFEENGNKKDATICLLEIGRIFSMEGDNAKAIECFTEALTVFEQLDDKANKVRAYTSIGIIHAQQGNLDKALIFFEKGVAIQGELGDLVGVANSMNNIGNIYQYQGNMEKAKDCYTKSLNILEKKDLISDMGSPLNNIGSIYQKQGDYDQALEYYKRSLTVQEKIDDQFGISRSLSTISVFYTEINNYPQAIAYGEKSIAISKKIGALSLTNKSALNLSTCYKKLGNYEKSLEMYSLHIQARDSIDSEKNKKAIIQQEFKYEYEKQAAADSVKSAEAIKVQHARLEVEQAKNKQQEQEKYLLFSGLAVAILFGLFIFNRFRVTNKQKEIIIKQKDQVDEAFLQLEEKNQEITDSILYAKRIQSAILPPEKAVKEHLPESFILYKPKDIVAGDFYWLETIDNKVLFAAADCTGHGVPGAMVSVICNNGLNRSVREYGLTDPGKILDSTRKIVIEEFEKSEEDVKDGMDIALCSLENKTLKFAGAHNPLWILRKNTSEIEEIKANKQPIGKFDTLLPYQTHTLELDSGDTIYIFSDGYADQFGGEKGKKFKTSNFKKLLISIRNETIEKQFQLINENFENWKGTIEQLDDVCVIGVRI